MDHVPTGRDASSVPPPPPGGGGGAFPPPGGGFAPPPFGGAPPPRDGTPTEAPVIEDPNPVSRVKEVLAVLGIIVSIAIIFLAVYPFISDDDDSTTGPIVTDAEGNPVTSTSLDPLATTTLAPVPETTVATTVPVASGPIAVPTATATCTAPDSSDSRGNPLSFAAQNIVDADPATGWRCPGDGLGQVVTFTLAAPATITELGTIPGFAVTDPFNGDDRFVENRRVVSGRWSCVGAGGVQTASAIQTFADDRNMQVTPVNGFTSCAALTFEITGSTPAGRRDFVALWGVTVTGTPG